MQQRGGGGTGPSGGDLQDQSHPQPSHNTAKAEFGRACAALHCTPLSGCVGAGPGWYVAEFSGVL